MNSLVYIYGIMLISFILVEPGVPGNIGAAARAIKTMGFSDLRLVNPCDHLSEEARMLAHGSHDILGKANIFASLEEALQDLDLAVATTAKKRHARVEYSPVARLPELLRIKGSTVRCTGIVFGREESGLTNNEILLCDMVSTVPIVQAYPSLNLAQAVMIYAYILSGCRDVSQKRPQIIDREGFRAMMDRATHVLAEMGLKENPALYNRLLERLAWLGEDDIHLVHSVLNRYMSLREGD